MRDNREYNYHRKAEWYSRTRMDRLRQMRDWRRKVHSDALAILGNRCACCGEKRITMLEIDHVHGGGGIERKADNRNNFRLYQRIRDGKCDLALYQILCSNCNHSKRRNGLCEHYTEKWACWIEDDGMDPGPYPLRNTESDVTPRHMEWP